MFASACTTIRYTVCQDSRPAAIMSETTAFCGDASRVSVNSTAPVRWSDIGSDITKKKGTASAVSFVVGCERRESNPDPSRDRIS